VSGKKSYFASAGILETARNPVSIAVYVFTLSCFLASRLAFLNLKGETGKMRRLALTMTLACVLSGAVRAGEIHTTGAVAMPTPSPVTATGEIPSIGVTIAGEIDSTGATTPQESSALITIILTIISIVP
jgi:hypothetical protein